jgi:hypothetical protein
MFVFQRVRRAFAPREFVVVTAPGHAVVPRADQVALAVDYTSAHLRDGVLAALGRQQAERHEEFVGVEEGDRVPGFSMMLGEVSRVEFVVLLTFGRISRPS